MDEKPKTASEKLKEIAAKGIEKAKTTPGIRVRPPKPGMGTITFLGKRHEDDLLEDDDGSGVVE